MSFNREKFLLILLSSIFAYQATVFAFGVWTCTQITPKASVREICPDLGNRYDSTFQVMIATTLALLTGGAAMNLNQRKSSSRPPEPPQKPQTPPPAQPNIGPNRRKD